MIAVISGLIVKVVGEPIAQVMGPKVEDVAEEAADFLHDQRWEKRLNRWIEDWFSQEKSSI